MGYWVCSVEILIMKYKIKRYPQEFLFHQSLKGEVSGFKNFLKFDWSSILCQATLSLVHEQDFNSILQKKIISVQPVWCSKGTSNIANEVFAKLWHYKGENDQP